MADAMTDSKFICTTQLAVDTVQEVLQRSLKTNATIVKHEAAQIGLVRHARTGMAALCALAKRGPLQGHGYLSVMARVQLEWSDRSNTALPQSIVVKVPSTSHFERFKDAEDESLRRFAAGVLRNYWKVLLRSSDGARVERNE